MAELFMLHRHTYTHTLYTHTHTMHTYVRRPSTVNTFSLHSNRLIITHVRVTMGLYEIICVKLEKHYRIKRMFQLKHTI